MQKKTNNFILNIALTGLAFMAGGIVRTFLVELTYGTGSYFIIFTVPWLAFMVEAVLGVTVLSYLFRNEYPFHSLWRSGMTAFALGSVVPAVLFNYTFYWLLILPGILISLILDRLICKRGNRGAVAATLIIGFLIPQLYIFFFRELTWIKGLSDFTGIGPMSLIFIFADLFIGIFAATGVGLALRLRKSPDNGARTGIANPSNG